MVVQDIICVSSFEFLLKPREVFVWNTIHLQEHVLHHEDDLTVLWLFVVPNKVTLFHQRNQVLRSLVTADLLRGLLQLEFLHGFESVISGKEDIAHFEVLWLG